MYVSAPEWRMDSSTQPLEEALRTVFINSAPGSPLIETYVACRKDREPCLKYITRSGHLS